MAKKRGPTPPRDVRLQARGRPGEIRPIHDRGRARRRANIITGVVIGALVLGAVVAGVLATRGEEDDASLSTSNAPWPALSDGLSRRMARADIPPPGQETYHEHIHLDVFVNGVPTPVPNGLGISTDQTVFAGIHTHDESGVIHLEANEDFGATLQDVFTIWGVRLSETCVGGYCAPDTPIEVHVNGERVEDFVGYELQEHDQVAIVIGEPPDEIPDSYDFESNPTVNPETPQAPQSPEASPTGAGATPTPTAS